MYAPHHLGLGECMARKSAYLCCTASGLIFHYPGLLAVLPIDHHKIKTMKHTLTIILTTAIWISLPIASVVGQNQKAKKPIFKEQFAGSSAATGTFSYTFSKSTGTYQDLTGATSLNNNQTWDDPAYIVPMDFPFTMFGKTIDSLSFDFSLGGSLMGFCGSDSLYETGLLPFEADLVDLGHFGAAGTSLSPLSYKVEQGSMPWNRILKIEWKNVGSYDDTTYTDYVNFQLWLYEGSDDIEIHYGPSSIAVDTLFFYGESGPLVGALQMNPLNFDLANINLLAGTATSPSLTDSIAFVEGAPVDGTIYKFSNQVSGMDSPNAQNILRAYPNPVSGTLTLEWEAHIALVSLYNGMGQQVVEEKLSPNNRKHPLNLSGLAPGLYHLHLQTAKGLMIQTIVKE
jgi:hypothetical protein